MRITHLGVPLLGLLLATQACIFQQMASVGTFPVIDDKVMAKVTELNDPELSADVNRVPQTPRAGTGEYYAALCLKQYVDARYAEYRLGKGPVDDPMQKATLEGDANFYGGCASTCKAAYTQVTSSYSDLASKYHPRCEQAAASKNSKMILDALAAQVETFRNAKTPLDLYYGERDSEAALAQASAQTPPNDARLAQLGQDIKTLSAQHAAEIRKAKAFIDTPAAQDNSARREALDVEIASLESDMKAIRDSQDSLTRSGSLDSYMEKRKLDDQLRAKERVVEVKRSEIERLREEYNRLATRAGVL